MTVDLEAIRKRLYNLQAEMAENPFDSFTVEAMQEVVADASALADEVERLRAFEATIRRITGLPTDDELIHGSGPEPLGILNAERTP